MTVAGAGLAVFVDPMFALLAAASVGIAIPVFMLGNPRASLGERNAAQETFEKLGVEEPDTWDIPSVEFQLRSLERKTVVVEASLQRARDRDVERHTLTNELNGLSEMETALKARRQKLKDSLKLDSILSDAELVDFARALDQLRLARSKEEGVAGKVEKKVNWILDADIRGFFDAIDHGWLMTVVEHRTLHPYPEQRLRVMT